MTTPLDIVQGAVSLLGVLRKSEAISSDEAADGLTRLNELIDSWSNDSMMCYARIWESFPLSPGVSIYAIGSGQAFNTGRPIQIVSAYTRIGTIDYPMEQIPDDDYALQISYKSISMAYPTVFNYDNGLPANIRLWPVPATSSTLFLQSEKQIASFPSLATTVTLPPGWLRALRYALALELAPEYGVQINPLIQQGAMEAKSALKIADLRNRPITRAPGSRGWYAGYSDTIV